MPIESQTQDISGVVLVHFFWERHHYAPLMDIGFSDICLICRLILHIPKALSPPWLAGNYYCQCSGLLRSAVAQEQCWLLGSHKILNSCAHIFPAFRRISLLYYNFICEFKRFLIYIFFLELVFGNESFRITSQSTYSKNESFLKLDITDLTVQYLLCSSICSCPSKEERPFWRSKIFHITM